MATEGSFRLVVFAFGQEVRHLIEQKTKTSKKCVGLSGKLSGKSRAKKELKILVIFRLQSVETVEFVAKIGLGFEFVVAFDFEAFFAAHFFVSVLELALTVFA